MKSRTPLPLSRIYHWLLPLGTILWGILFTGCQIGTQTNPAPPPTPSAEIKPTLGPAEGEPITEEEFRERWLYSPPCLPPCWEGITPGKTTALEAITILEASPLFANVFSRESPVTNLKNGSVLWDFTLNGEVFRGEAKFSTETADQIIFMIVPRMPFVTLGEMIAAFGEPSHIMAYVTPPIHSDDTESWWVDIIWFSKGLVFGKAGSVPFPMIDEMFSSNSVAYFTPGLEGYAKLVNPDLMDQLKPWQGYGDFEEYYVPETVP